jgi:hypothetical protein
MDVFDPAVDFKKLLPDVSCIEWRILGSPSLAQLSKRVPRIADAVIRRDNRRRGVETEEIAECAHPVLTTKRTGPPRPKDSAPGATERNK